jgi:hypothetical protein
LYKIVHRIKCVLKLFWPKWRVTKWTPDPLFDGGLVENVDGPEHEVAEPDGDDGHRHERDECHADR